MSELTYLNHAGTSWPKPAAVPRAEADWSELDPGAWPAQFARAHRRVAEFFRTEPELLLLTPSCTAALAVAVADLPWNAGDCVVTSSWEHHGLYRPLRKLEEQGVRLEVLPGRPGEPLDLDALEHLLKHAPVRLVALSAASNLTGELLPLTEAIGAARAHGARVLIDGAQLAGWADIDLTALGADLFAFAGHKGLQAPWGIGGLYIAPSLVMQSPAAACQLEPDSEAALWERGRCGTRPGYCDVGSANQRALAGLAAAVDWLDEPAQQDRLQQARATIGMLEAALAEVPRVRLLSPPDFRQRVPSLAVAVSGTSPSEAARRLAEHGVVAASGLLCAPLAHQTLGTLPQGVLRLSAGPLPPPDPACLARTVARCLGEA